MGNYEPDQEEVKRRSGDAVSNASAKFRTAAANRLDALGEHRRAFRVRTCRPRKEGGFPCKDGVLCDHCRNVLAIKTKRNYIPRVLAAMKDGEPRLLLSVTLTMGEGVDLDAKCKELRDLLGSISDTSPVWSEATDMFWFLHEERGESRRTWRPHYHGVLVVKAADFLGFKNHYRRLVLAWARAAWAVLHPSCPVPESEESDSPFRRLLEQQKIKPVYCFQRSQVLSLQDAKHDPRAIVQDLSALIEYGLKRKEQDASHPRGPRMRTRDYVEIALRTNNKRGLKGRLHGVAPESLRAAMLDLEELAVPIEAEQNGRCTSDGRTKKREARRTR